MRAANLKSFAPPKHFVFLTLPGYSFMAVSSAIEALQTANTVCKRLTYRWSTASVDGQPVAANNGLRITPTVNVQALERADIVFVCGGSNIQDEASDEVMGLLRSLAMRHTAMGGLCTGAYALAKAGLLNQYKAAIHWENKFSAQELFARVLFTDKLFTVDRDRFTCAGGTAALHLMLKLIKDQLGASTVTTVSGYLNLDRIRDEHERQCTPMQSRVGNFQAHLIEIAELMEANIEEPLSLNDIAELVGISRRQLERLFKRYVGEIPNRFYTNLRLHRARDLVLQTTLTMRDVALACGFSNGAYFSRCYRTLFGITPSAERASIALKASQQSGRFDSDTPIHFDVRVLADLSIIDAPGQSSQLNSFTHLYATGIMYATQ